MIFMVQRRTITYANTIVLSKINEYGVTILVNNVCIIELGCFNFHTANFEIYFSCILHLIVIGRKG